MNYLKFGLYILALCVGLWLNSEVYSQDLKWMEGKWNGQGYQQQGTQTEIWAMHLSYSAVSGEANIHVEYPTLLCSGFWSLQSIEENRGIFIENITKGIENCLNGSRLIVSFIDDNYITVAFYDIVNKQQILATAVLTRMSN